MADSVGGEVFTYKSLRIYLSCENTIAWLKENGLVTEVTMKEMVRRYGGATAEFITFTDGSALP